MIIPLLASVITVGNIPSYYTDEQLRAIDEEFDNLFRNLSYMEDFGGFADEFKRLFEYAAENPLCVMFIVVTLVVMAFRLCPLIFRSFRR